MPRVGRAGIETTPATSNSPPSTASDFDSRKAVDVTNAGDGAAGHGRLGRHPAGDRPGGLGRRLPVVADRRAQRPVRRRGLPGRTWTGVGADPAPSPAGPQTPTPNGRRAAARAM